MKTDLSHLPEGKRHDVEAIAEFLRAEPGIDAEMMILFGSHARGDWVEDYTFDGPVMYSYISDYDILVVVPNLRYQTKPGRWSDIETKAARLVPLHGPSVNLIFHDIDYLNARLGEGRYFFRDIKEEGVLLYDSGRFTLAEPRELTRAELRKIAEEDYEQWFESADVSLEDYATNLERAQQAGPADRKYLNKAAFELHQATERFYAAFLLVHTGYKPKFHDIEKLGKLAAAEMPGMLHVFPRATDEEKARFDLLKRAYVDARYSKTYAITREDLEYLAARVGELRTMTEAACRKKIDDLAS
ncbi:MAG: HEPN domain-containing protein [Planctomycetota bacterium]|jgi:predicted nucleotidyltransferase/HEPN domain-containing protein